MTRTLHIVAEAPTVEGRRDVVTAVRRGFFGRCPHCGEGRMFRVLSQGGRRLSRLRRGSEPAARGRRARLRHDADHGALHRRRHPRGRRTMAEFANVAARRRLVRARCSMFAVAVAAKSRARWSAINGRCGCTASVARRKNSIETGRSCARSWPTRRSRSSCRSPSQRTRSSEEADPIRLALRLSVRAFTGYFALRMR